MYFQLQSDYHANMDKLQAERNMAINSIQQDAVDTDYLEKKITWTFFFGKWTQFHKDVALKRVKAAEMFLSKRKLYFRKCFMGWKAVTAQLQRDKALAKVKELETQLTNMQARLIKKDEENEALR
jgi:hypothetical protein